MTQYGFFFDQSRCYGCKACTVACKDWHDIAPGPEKWMSVYIWETGTFPYPRINTLAFNCGHCEDPVCSLACPNGAIFKEEKYGAVLVDREKCDGCRSCFEACPYGAPKYADDKRGTKMSKCTMCIDRLERGDMPVCANACPMRALDFGPIEEMVLKHGGCQQLAEMPSPDLTHPNWVAKGPEPKRELVRLDEKKVIELSQKRGDMGDIYSDKTNLTSPPEGMITRNKLNMKNATVDDVMFATRSDQG